MIRVDLDAVQARQRRVVELYSSHTEGGYYTALAESAADVPALAAELRAAREVVKAARGVMMPTDAAPWDHRLVALGETIADYNEAVGS